MSPNTQHIHSKGEQKVEELLFECDKKEGN